MSENEEGVIDGIFWANGFVHGMSICKDIWEPLLDDKKAIEIVTPMIIVARQALGEEGPPVEKVPEDKREETLELMFQNLNIAYAYLRGNIKKFNPDQNSPITPINQNQKIVH